jgi:hypothetical protein
MSHDTVRDSEWMLVAKGNVRQVKSLLGWMDTQSRWSSDEWDVVRYILERMVTTCYGLYSGSKRVDCSHPWNDVINSIQTFGQTEPMNMDIAYGRVALDDDYDIDLRHNSLTKFGCRPCLHILGDENSSAAPPLPAEAVTKHVVTGLNLDSVCLVVATVTTHDEAIEVVIAAVRSGWRNVRIEEVSA